MQETPRPIRHSHEVNEKDDVTHVERVATHTPPSEMEKGLQLKPTPSGGPVVHEKVIAPLDRPCSTY